MIQAGNGEASTDVRCFLDDIKVIAPKQHFFLGKKNP